MGRKINLNSFFILGIFIFIALIFYYPIFLGKLPFNGNLLVSFWSPWNYNLPFKFMGVDEIREFFPLFNFTYENLRSGSLPFWNPYNFAGTPHLANWAGAVFYPLNLTFFLFSKVWSFIFLKLSAIFLPGFFTYLYLRALTLDKKSSFFGAAAFAFSATLLIWEAEIWQSVHTVLWLPLVLVALEKIVKTKKIVWVILGALALAFSVMAGYTQTTIYVYLFSLTYALFRGRGWKTFSLIIGTFILSLAFSAIHTIPAIEFFLLSPRREISLLDVNLSFLLPLRHIVTFFVPDVFGSMATGNWFIRRPGQYYESMIYIGVVPLAISSFAFFLKKFRGYVLFFSIWAILALSLVFDLPTSRLVYYTHVPFLSTAIAIRIIFLVAFSVSVLSAFGLSWWIESGQKEKRKLILGLLPLIAIYGVIGFWLLGSFVQKSTSVEFPTGWWIVSLRNFILPGGIFITTVILLFIGFKQVLKKYFYFLLVLLLIIHSFIFAQKYFSFTDQQFLYPDHPMLKYLQENLGQARFWGYGRGVLENNFATVYNLYSPEGYDPVNIKSYNELLSSANTGDFRGIASRSDALIPRTDISPLVDDNQFRLRLLDLLGVKFVVYKGEVDLENERFKPVWQENGFTIFENKNSFERAFLAPEVIYADSREEAIKMMYDPSIDLSRKVVLEEKITLPKLEIIPTGLAKIVEYSPNKVVIKSTSNSPQFLVLSDVYYPGWKASINGTPTKIYQADYAFRAVLIPEGENEVVFTYRPTSLLLGILVSGVQRFKERK